MIINTGGTGSGASLRAIAVASESALPSSARDGTVAVVTGTSVASVYVQNTEPSSPKNGDVWVTVSSASATPIVLGKITLYPAQYKQYISGAWENVTAFVRCNGEWQEGNVFLYYKGDLFADVTGGWNRYSSYSAVVEFNDNHVYLDEGNNGYHSSAIQTVKPITFSGFSKLKCQCVNSGGQIYKKFYLRIYSSKGNRYQYSSEAWTDGTVVAEQSSSELGTVELTLDISKYADTSYYVGIKSDTVLQVNAIWLEA